MNGSVGKIFVAAFMAAAGELAVVEPNGRIVVANDAWRNYGDHRGAGPRGEIGTNYWHLTTRAAVAGDEVAATAADALEAVFGGYVGRVSLDYDRGADARRFRLRIERLPGSGHFLISHEALAQPKAGTASGDSKDPPVPRQWVAHLS